MTRRVDRLVREGLVHRTAAAKDARGVCVTLSAKGMRRLDETAPAHLRRVSELFVDKLNDTELAVLARALRKVRLNCSFG
jgi:DNA-binding MarR family transcriptional regulator